MGWYGEMGSPEGVWLTVRMTGIATGFQFRLREEEGEDQTAGNRLGHLPLFCRPFSVCYMPDADRLVLAIRDLEDRSAVKWDNAHQHAEKITDQDHESC